MATEFSREFFSENRIVKADLRAAHPVSYTHLDVYKRQVMALPEFVIHAFHPADLAEYQRLDELTYDRKEDVYKRQAKALLPDRRVGLMHGKLKPKEKAAVMDDFKAGRLDALVSTTVIEVGVDVPNATVMVIENAERYGLSALHQLRGRVGRGAAESWCFLVSDNTAESVQKRLKFLCSTSDGFAVAQFDLETRGPGDFFGSRQHGLPTLQIADLMNDTRTLSLIHI